MAELCKKEDVRFFLLDRYPEDNDLHEALEFSDAELDYALELTVSKYNTTLPILCKKHTVEDFPYRYELLCGVSSILLRMKAVNMARNNLDYQHAEGAAINEKAKRQEYLGLSAALDGEFLDRIRMIKVSLNANDLYGYV